MKPFDLDAAVNGAALQTRDGRDVTEFYYFKSASGNYPITAITRGNKLDYTLEGRYEKAGESDDDLFLKSEKKKLFVAIYKEAEISSDKWHINAAYSCTDLSMLKSRYDLSEKNWHIVEVEIDI